LRIYHNAAHLRIAKQSSNRLVMVSRILVCVLLLFLSGCGGGRELAPVTGKVLYQGEPLKFGSVMLQPISGQPATAIIQSDGTFEVKTFGEGLGAVVGRNKVRIVCYEAQDPNHNTALIGGETAFGRSLIPKRYTSFDTSNLEVDIQSDHSKPLLLELTDER